LLKAHRGRSSLEDEMTITDTRRGATHPRADDAWSPTELATVDPSGLWQRLAAFPDQALEAWDLAIGWPDIPACPDIRRVVILGMGGSAIGGQLAARLVEQRTPVPVQLVRDSVPPVTDDQTLVIASSFSGETEEVLSAFKAASYQPGVKLVVTRGGALAQQALSLQIPSLHYECDGEPRSALGYGLMLLLGVLKRAGVFPADDTEILQAVSEVRAAAASYHPHVPVRDNPARSLARQIKTATPVILADASLAAAGVRWQTQFNENSKRWAFTGVLPEALHNLVEAMQVQEVAGPDMPFHVLLLEDESRLSRASTRLDAMQEILDDACIRWTRLAFNGTSDLSILLQACVLGDWVSYYLALEDRVDPSPVPVISQLKAYLASHH